jgi:outer membrane protein assembly factor BamB
MTSKNIWQTFGGNNQRTGCASKAITATAVQEQRLQTTGNLANSPVCAPDESIFLADMNGGVCARRPDGEQIWQKRLNAGIYATPALNQDGSRLFVGTFQGSIYALDTETGEIIWRHDIFSRRDPRLLADLLFLPKHALVIGSSWSETFVALDAESGKERLSWSAGRTPYAPAAADEEENVYILRAEVRWGREEQPSGIRLLRVNPETGRKLHCSLRSRARKNRWNILKSPPRPCWIRREIGFILSRTAICKAICMHSHWMMTKSYSLKRSSGMCTPLRRYPPMVMSSSVV